MKDKIKTASAHELVQKQRAFFESGQTRPLAFRLDHLQRLQASLLKHEQDVNRAVKEDLNKSPFETYMTETGIVLSELRFLKKYLPRWVKERRVRTPLVLKAASSFIVPEPYGVALIMSPWNYPVQLTLNPLVASIAAGNCSIVKPSAYAPATSRLLASLLQDLFPPEFVAVVEGGREENRALLEEQFDFIFFTGSTAVGRVVMEAASRHLTPLVLELGGKSPAIVDETADIKLAARRIAFGKVLNAGQTCVEPDYLLIDGRVKEAFIEYFKRALLDFFPDGDYTDYPCIVSDRHFQRLESLLEGQTIRVGGGRDPASRLFEPTLLDQVDPQSPVMQEEIFGPILPLVTFEELDQCIRFIRERPKPLALYLFTNDKARERRILDSCSFGGGAINDTIMHLASPYLPFGGVGESGMGSYHGYKSFETFSHMRSLVRQSKWIDLPIRYRPYRDHWFKLLKKLMR
ncbi:MAG: aldehyde dehydrogenase [Clostridiaceae bacterium]|nr:aldehyde dehydrogenase [Clostridiaceae bacterium]